MFIASAQTVASGNTSPTAALPVTSTVPSAVSYRDVVQSGATTIVICNQSGYPGSYSVRPPLGSEHISADVTNNLIRQLLSANQSVPPAITSGSQASQDGYINIDGTFYHRANAHTLSANMVPQ